MTLWLNADDATPAPTISHAGSVEDTRPLPLLRALLRGLVQALPHFVVLIGCFEVYHLISNDVPRRTSLAHAHALGLVALERRLGIFREPQIQYLALHHAPLSLFGGILGGPAVRKIFTLIYDGGQFPWLASILFWLYLFHREHFVRVRNLAVLGTLSAIIFAAVYPVAPPRFTLAGAPYHMLDVTGVPISEQALVRMVGFNPYASLPSIHTFWALLTGFSLYLCARNLVARLLVAAAFPAAVVLSVVITGNHFMLDCLASFALLAICIVLEGAWERVCARMPARRPAIPAVRNRRRAPNLRPLDGPLVLCACAETVLLLGADQSQRVLGLLLLTSAALGVRLVGWQVRTGCVLRERAVTAEWWSGLLLVIGATTLGADMPDARLAGAVLWIIACALPFVARSSPVLGDTDRIRLSQTLERTPLLPRLSRGLVQALPHVALLLAGFLMYHNLNIPSTDRAARAFSHAASLVDLERRLGIFWEPQLQHGVLHPPALPIVGGILNGTAIGDTLAVLYAHGHSTWLASMLLWLYLFRREHFALMRNIVMVTTLSAVAVRAVYPVAPPLLSLAGAPYHVVSLTGLPPSWQMYAPQLNFGLYGAMPSLHVLWALLTGLGLWFGIRNPLGRVLALLFPIAMVVTVIVTGNHYILDVLGSVGLIGVCALVMWGWQRLRPAASRRAPRPIDQPTVVLSLQAFDCPLVLCACAGTVLLLSTDLIQHVMTVLLWFGAAALTLRAQQHVRLGLPVRERAITAEWWGGLLFVSGSTLVVADSSALRFAGGVIWLAACALPLLGRSRPAPLLEKAVWYFSAREKAHPVAQVEAASR